MAVHRATHCNDKSQMSINVLGYMKATASVATENTQKLIQQIPNAKISTTRHCFMRLHTAWSHGSEYISQQINATMNTFYGQQTMRVYQKIGTMCYLHFLFVRTINYMRNYNYRQNHLVLVLTPQSLWYYGSKINMANPLAECTLCPTKIKQPAILYAPIQLQSQFKYVTPPIFVNLWSLSSIHYNQPHCVHINQKHQYICRKPGLSYLPETVMTYGPLCQRCGMKLLHCRITFEH